MSGLVGRRKNESGPLAFERAIFLQYHKALESMTVIYFSLNSTQFTFASKKRYVVANVCKEYQKSQTSLISS